MLVIRRLILSQYITKVDSGNVGDLIYKLYARHLGMKYSHETSLCDADATLDIFLVAT